MYCLLINTMISLLGALEFIRQPVCIYISLCQVLVPEIHLKFKKN